MIVLMYSLSLIVKEGQDIIKLMKIMISILAVVLLCTGCAAPRALDDGLEMPEKYLGYWEPYSRLLLGRGMDITPTTISYKLDPEFFDDLKSEELITEHIADYKIIHIDDERVYMVLSERPTKAYYDRRVSINPTAYSREDYENFMKLLDTRDYSYASFELIKPHPKRRKEWTNIRLYDTSLSIKEEEWSLPIEQLWINYNDNDRHSKYHSNTWCRCN